MGYYSDNQTKLANYFKGLLINWLMDIENKSIIMNDLKYYIKIKNYDDLNNYIYNIPNIETNNSNNISILFILNNIIKVPIVIYDITMTILYVFDKKIINKNNFNNYKNNKANINLLYEFNDNNNIANKIYTIYFI